MRILLVVHHALEADSGAAGSVMALAGAYRRRGHTVQLMSHDDLPARLTARVREPAFPWFVAARLMDPRQTGAVDVIDASTGDAWLWGRLRRGRGNPPLLVTRSHGLEHGAHEARRAEARAGNLELSWKYPLYYGGVHLAEVGASLRLADAAFFLNRHDRDYAVERLRVAPGKAYVVRNGIPDALLGLPEPVAASSTPRIAQVGTYIPRKGVHHGARALERLMRERSDVEVRFLGTACDRERVLADFDPALHDRIEVMPRFSREELPALLADCQIKLFPTLYEGFGKTVLEAMACGLAPVTTTVPGPTMFVRDGRNGVLVPPADSEALRTALRRLLDEPRLLERLRLNAWKTAQAYDWQAAADERLAIYERLLAGRRRGAVAALPASAAVNVHG
jgi:glycosyltransferase involved in cell wall biosynthesis